MSRVYQLYVDERYRVVYDPSEDDVEFYDLKHFPERGGQFTGARYYTASLLRYQYPFGLDLNGGQWIVSAEGMDQVQKWLIEAGA